MTGDHPGVTEVKDYSIRKRVGGLIAIGAFAFIWMFVYTGRSNSVSVAADFGLSDMVLEGILAGLLAIAVGIAIALSGYVTD